MQVSCSCLISKILVAHSILEGPQKTTTVQMQRSNKILVKNLPAIYDKEHLQMFFEYEKGQGGGPVTKVTLNHEENKAVVEFENESGMYQSPITDSVFPN